MASTLKKVCLVGANGSLGTVVLDGLVKCGLFDVSIILRSNSSSQPAHGDSITKISVSADMGLDELTTALKGQDAVVATFPLKDVNPHLRLVEAAFRAGVRRYIPADFGSCDATNPLALEALQLYRDRILVQAKCEKLGESAEQDGGTFTWTTIVGGHFFDWGLKNGFLKCDLDKHTAVILDDGTEKASASTLPRLAESVIRVLQRPNETRNRFVYVQSFNPSQLDIVAALERATGVTWEKTHVNSKEFMRRERERLEAGDKDAVQDVVFALGAVDADWTLRKDYAMDLLGLEDENLDDIVSRVVAENKVSNSA